jgi:nucleotidyltransferase/DNA polymerase involved in DNA repair
MPIFQLKKLFPQVAILSSSYHDYSLYSERMCSITRRYSHQVEEYSVDECFADITDMPSRLNKSYEEIASAIKSDLEQSLGITFSLGLAPTKVLAKVGSKHKKPSGLVFIPLGSQNEVLAKTAIGAVWGIGRATAEKLQLAGIKTALDFIQKPEWWVKETFAKPQHHIWQELQGMSVSEVHTERQDIQKSIMSTRTFTPATTDKKFILSQLSKNVEGACRHARERGLLARHVFCYLKSQDFQYLRFEMTLPRATNIPTEVLASVTPMFNKVFKPGFLYRATGVTLGGTQEDDLQQTDLFGGLTAHTKLEDVYRSLDTLSLKYGKHAVMLGSSMDALKNTETFEEKPFSMPSLGDVY